MSFPPAFLEELRNRLPLSGLIGKRIKLTRAGREYKGCCPFHNEKTPSFYVNDDKQFYHCFGCGAHGDAIGFTMRHDRLSFPEAIETLASQAGLAVPRDTPIEREHFDQEKRLHQVLERATLWFEEQLFLSSGSHALSYIRGRSLSDEGIKRFRLGYAPNDGQALIRKLTGEGFKLEEMMAVGLVKKAEDRNDHYSFFRNRLIFPVGDRRGRIVAFGGRVLGEGEPKYLNSPDHPLFHKGRLLYGLSRARAALGQNQPLIVVEGYMDVIALVEAGYSGAVAPLGTALTEDQLGALWNLLPPLDARDPARDYSPILCFDGDNAGLRAAARTVERALPLLTAGHTVRIATMTGAKDPDDLIRQSGKSGMDAVLKQARPMIDALWEMMLAGRPMRTPEERSAFTVALRQRVNRIADENLRQLYHDEMQKRLAAAFNWRQAEQAAPRGNWKDQRRAGTIAPPMVSRRQPPSAIRQMEKALLAVMLNHPALFEEFGEDLGHIDFASLDFEVLRRRIVDIMLHEAAADLTHAELYRHIDESMTEGEDQTLVRQALAETLSEPTYVLFGFARHDRPIEQARQGWISIWNKHLQNLHNAELQFAKRLHQDNPSEENWHRLLLLRAQIASANQEDENVVPEQAMAQPAQIAK
jgi:DNA primase